MNAELLFERLNSVFRDVFDDAGLTVDGNTTAADVDGWDSLTHIALIAAVEDEFGFSFGMKEVVGMKNVGDMAAIIASRGK